MEKPQQRRPIDIKSPIARMFFGPFKGTVIWKLPQHEIDRVSRMNVTPRTLEVFEQAELMAKYEGQYAVMADYINEPHMVDMKVIYEYIEAARLALDPPTSEVKMFVYHIKEKPVKK